MDAQQTARCIECEEIDLARVYDQRPVQTLPIPAAVLRGFPEGRSPADLTRRRLLEFGLAGFASVYGPRVLGWESVWEGVAAQATPASTNCLVMLYLAGGNDGLNVLVPGAAADYAAYSQLRPALHRGQGATSGGVVGSQALAGAAGAALSWANVGVSTPGGGDNGSSTYGFDTLYGNGNGGAGNDLAVLPAVDYMPPNLSHFESSDYWFSGALSELTTGWLGRWIDRNGSPNNPLQAVSIDTALSKAIRTASNPVAAIPSLGSLGFTMNPSGGYGSPGGAAASFDANGQVQALAGVPADPSNQFLGRSRGTYGLAVNVYNTGHGLTLGSPPAGVTYPSNVNQQGSLSFKLRMAALLLGANVGTRIVTIHWGAFDTHGGQVASQDPQLSELSVALSAFKAELVQLGIEQNVSTLIFSEFGRRVGENASAGTDHGAGGLMMLSGSAVRGGFASPFPGCTSAALDANGNLQVPTDFRTVYQSVINEWLGDDPSAILPGTPQGGFPALVRQDSGSNLFK
jgi:uncharacterized protein (DUF1501 family)